MKNRSARRALLMAGTMLGINLVPPGIVLLRAQSAETAMVLYFLENLVSVCLAAARVRILAPARSAAYSGATVSRADKATGRSRLGPLPPVKAEALLEQSLGRVFVLYLAVFAEVFLALFMDHWFVLPFAILKTIVDLAVPT